MTDWLGLTGRCAVVAGVGGIGGEIARGLFEQGASVVAIDSSSQALESLEKAAELSGGRFHGIVADLSSAKRCDKVVAETIEQFGAVDVFVHAVGINDRRPLLETPDDVWERIVTVNLNTAFWLGRSFGKQMVERGHGRMVYVSSVSGLLGHKNHAPYAATKGGLNQLVKVAAHEWASSGVTVNAIAPGYMETDLTAEYLEQPGRRAELETLVPAGRLGRPQDVVGAALFLISDRAAFITGQVVYVDGGRTLV